MNVALRILVFLVLVINAVSLYFSAELYKKRELLKGRGELYKDYFVKVSKTLENEDPVDPASPAVYPARDIAQVTDQLQDNPETDTFWDGYVQKYEQANLPAMDIDSSDAKRAQLNAYYRTQTDESGKIVPATDSMGNYITEGQGTARLVLEQVFDRAKAQNALLNKTREQLVKLREELVTVITDYNSLKQDGRRDKHTIKEKEAEIEKLKADIAEKEAKIEQMEARRKELEVELSDAKAEVAEKQEKIETLETDIANLNKALEQATQEIKRLKQDPASGGTGGGFAVANLTAGVKGEVVKVDNENLFAIIRLGEDAMKELLGENLDAPLPSVELHVKRPGFKGPAGEYVTRIRLRKAFLSKKDGKSNLIVADILPDWQQAPMEVKDVIFY